MSKYFVNRIIGLSTFMKCTAVQSSFQLQKNYQCETLENLEKLDVIRQHYGVNDVHKGKISFD